MMTNFNHTLLNSSYVDIYVDPIINDKNRTLGGDTLNLTWTVSDY